MVDYFQLLRENFKYENNLKGLVCVQVTNLNNILNFYTRAS